MKSEFEEAVEGFLRGEGIRYVFEQSSFPIRVRDKEITYTPDFSILDIMINGRKVLLELHPEIGREGNQFDDKWIEKMVAFRHSESALPHHLILVTDIDPVKLVYLLRNRGLSALELCDEIWFKLDPSQKFPRNGMTVDIEKQLRIKTYNGDERLRRLIMSLKFRDELRVGGQADDAAEPS